MEKNIVKSFAKKFSRFLLKTFQNNIKLRYNFNNEYIYINIIDKNNNKFYNYKIKYEILDNSLFIKNIELNIFDI